MKLFRKLLVWAYMLSLIGLLGSLVRKDPLVYPILFAVVAVVSLVLGPILKPRPGSEYLDDIWTSFGALWEAGKLGAFVLGLLGAVAGFFMDGTITGAIGGMLAGAIGGVLIGAIFGFVVFLGYILISPAGDS